MHSKTRPLTPLPLLALLTLVAISASSRADMQGGADAQGLCRERTGGDNDRMWACCGDEVDAIGAGRAAELGVCRAGLTPPVTKVPITRSQDPSKPQTMTLPKGQGAPAAAPDNVAQPAAAASRTAAIQGTSPVTQDPKDPTKMLVDCSTPKGRQMYDMMSKNPGMIPGGIKMDCKPAP